MHVGTRCAPHEPRLVEGLVDIREGSGAELIGVTRELAFEELVPWGACCSPPVEEVGHRPDRIPQRCERAARAGIHVGSEYPPDLRHSRSLRLVDHGSEIVFDDLHPTGARSGKNRTPDPASDRDVDLLDQLLCTKKLIPRLFSLRKKPNVDPVTGMT